MACQISSIGVSRSTWWNWYRSMWSVCSRLRLASTARRMFRAESLSWLGQAVAVGAHVPVDLGGEDDLVAAVAALREPGAEDLLGAALVLAPAVDVRGVEEVDARLQGGVHEGVAVALVGLGAEVHRPQDEAADLESGASELRVLHGSPANSFERARSKVRLRRAVRTGPARPVPPRVVAGPPRWPASSMTVSSASGQAFGQLPGRGQRAAQVEAAVHQDAGDAREAAGVAEQLRPPPARRRARSSARRSGRTPAGRGPAARRRGRAACASVDSTASSQAHQSAVAFARTAGSGLSVSRA